MQISMMIRFLAAAVLSAFFVSCGDPTVPESRSTGTTPASPSGKQSCSCSGSVLLQTDSNGKLHNLGDFGTPTKCNAQLSTHPGCR